MDTAQWPQEIVVKPSEEIVTDTRAQKQQHCDHQGGGLDGKKVAIRPQKEQSTLNCPRCNSTNTKFCYYNNYSLTQPRYLCKTCKRYWTQGGSLRNIPVGGASKKINKRPPISSSSNSTSSSFSSASYDKKNYKLPDLVAPTNPKIHEAQDLSLAFPQDFRTISDLAQVPNSMDPPQESKTHMSCSASNSRGFTSFMPASVQDPNSVSVYTNGLSFLLEGLGGGSYGSQHQENTSGRVLFPFEDLKQAQSTACDDNNGSDHHQQNKEQGGDRISTGGYWTGMLGGGSW